MKSPTQSNGEGLRCLFTIGFVTAVIGLAACDRASAPEPPPTPEPTPVATVTPAPTPTPVPTPTPTPTPFIPRQRMELSRMFNDIEVRSEVFPIESEQTAAVDRVDPGSYQLDVQLRVAVPVAATTVEAFAKNDPKIVETLPGLPKLLESASVSPAFARLYEFKIENLRRNLSRLDGLLTRHNMFDCDTILELKNPETETLALLSLGDMDVNTDGSDGDRNFDIDGSSQFFQPQTSYRWRKRTDRPNQFLQSTRDRLAKFNEEYAVVGLPVERNRQLEAGIRNAEATLYELERFSFLISGNDPYIVLPTFMFREMEGPYSVAVGDFAVVVYDGVIYPAILGDAGPSFKFGEASVRLCSIINPRSSAFSRPVSSLRVAYIVFPGSSDASPGPPDLTALHARCTELMQAAGFANQPLHEWESLIQPWPTPTPVPTPNPTPEATPTTAEPTNDDAQIVSPSPETSPSPESSLQP